jgi:AraC-like DNA-binding protein
LKVYAALISTDGLTAFDASGLVYRFLMRLSERFLGADEAHPPAVAQAVRWLDEHFDDCALCLDDLAEAVGLSKFHLVRQFRHATGSSPMAWLQQRRMERAYELLAHTPMPIHKVGAQVGYRNASYFCAAFRRHHGLSPAHVRLGTGH